MTSEDLSPGRIAQIACLLEATARKPGNVHRFRDFDDCHYLDYLVSASVIGPPLDRAREVGVGPAVLEAVAQTRRVVATNTNLGMVLLLAPLAAVPPDEEELREGLLDVLRATTLDDARAVYQAIRLASPGGLGEAPDQDIADEPTVSLLDAMRLAAERDLVARQYANGYADVFQTVVPALRAALEAGRSLETAIAVSHVTLMTSHPDTLIARKRGLSEAVAALRMACKVIAAGWPDTEEGWSEFHSFDAWLRDEGHSRNPGASADVVAAGLFVALRDGTIPVPLPAGHFGWEAERGVNSPQRHEGAKNGEVEPRKALMDSERDRA